MTNFNLPINGFDLTVLIILIAFMYGAYRKGLILTLFSLCASLISLFITNATYPIVTRYIRENTTAMATIKDYLATKIDLAAMVDAPTLNTQMDYIKELKFPGWLVNSLLFNNNPEIYKLFNVSRLEDYILTYIANLIISVFAMLVVYAIVSAIMKLIIRSLNLVSKLPIISTFNKLGGILVGFLQATLFIWIGFTVYSLFFMNPKHAELHKLLQESVIAIKFYDTNIILKLLLGIGKGWFNG